MIWREYRGHNVVFALRSIICIGLAAVGLHGGQILAVRVTSTIASLIVALITARLADQATNHWRIMGSEESTVDSRRI